MLHGDAVRVPLCRVVCTVISSRVVRSPAERAMQRGCEKAHALRLFSTPLYTTQSRILASLLTRTRLARTRCHTHKSQIQLYGATRAL